MSDYKHTADSAFFYMLDNGYIVKVGPNLYSLGKEPDLLEEDDFIVKFWYLHKKRIGDGLNTKVFHGPRLQ